MLFYKEMRLRNVYIGLLLDCIFFLLLTFAIDYGDQSIEFPGWGVEWSVCILGGVISEQCIVLFFFVDFELVLGR